MIRKQADKDIDSIIDTWLRASIGAHDFVPPEFWQERVEVMRRVYIPNSETWVHELGGIVDGFFSLADNTLAALFVAPESQGGGIGRRLLDKAKSLRSRLELSVYTTNAKAVKFYEKNGFVAVTEQIDTHTGHDEMLMVWKS